MTDGKLSAELAAIRHRNEGRIEFYRYTEYTVEHDVAEGDVRRLLAAVDATLNLHGSVPWYAAASDCGHPEPEDDMSDEWQDWDDNHRMGSGGILICLLTQDDSFCPECTRVRYDTAAPEGDDLVSAPCDTRSAVLAGLSEAQGGGDVR